MQSSMKVMDTGQDALRTLIGITLDRGVEATNGYKEFN